MNLPKREVKDIYYGDDARSKLISGAEKMYNAVSSTYGAAGNNVILGMPYGDAVLTRDGVTVAKRVVLEDRAEDDAAQILKQASVRTNATAGDGTTATIVLAYNLFKRGNRLVAAGDSGMVIKKQILEDARKVIDFMQEESIKGDSLLEEVASVSAGDKAIGKLIADTIGEMGVESGITIREQSYPTLDIEKVNGYYFSKGFFALNQQVEFAKPVIFVSQKPMESNADIIPLLSRIVNGDNKDLVIIGDLKMNSEAMNTLIHNVSQGKLNAVVIPPPSFNDEGLLFMQDIAIYVGSKLFTKGDDIKSVKDTDDFFGSADKVQVNQDRAIILRGLGKPADIAERAGEIKIAMDEETSPSKKNSLEQRYSKFTGKIAIVNVGGATPTEMEELRYRVEDAIEATKSAMSDGVLTGGGTMLVRASELDISPVFKEALLDTFRKLMTNAGEPADYRLEQIRRAKAGWGFNLRNMSDNPVDLSKEGIYDATRAVVQTIENGASAAGSLLTVGTIIDPIDEDIRFNDDKA